MFFVRRFCHTTSLNQGCAKTSPAPFLMFPYLFEGSVSISLRIRSLALGLKKGGHWMVLGPLDILLYNAMGLISGSWNGGCP